MPLLAPEIGLVIRFDYLWKTESEAGQDDGVKDRPCVIVLSVDQFDDGGHQVMVCPISHTPPVHGQPAVLVPGNVARHIDLDDRQSWIKTHEVNRFLWPAARLPFGIAKTPSGHWFYGFIPPSLYRIVRDQVISHHRQGKLKLVDRDE